MEGRFRMRLKSSLWVSAYVRRVMQDGSFATVLRHGDDDAGAVFVKITTHSAVLCLYGPAPSYALEPGAGRKWQLLDVAADGIDGVLEREAAIDPDFWLVEVEDRDGRAFFEPHEIFTEIDDGGLWPGSQ